MSKIFDKPQHIEVSVTEDVTVRRFARDRFRAALTEAQEKLQGDRAMLEGQIQITEMELATKTSKKRALALKLDGLRRALAERGHPLEAKAFEQICANLDSGRYDEAPEQTLTDHLRMVERAADMWNLAIRVAEGAFTEVTVEKREHKEWIWVDADDPRVDPAIRKLALKERAAKEKP